MSKSKMATKKDQLAAPSSFSKGPAKLTTSPSNALPGVGPSPADSIPMTPLSGSPLESKVSIVIDPKTKTERFMNLLQGNGVRMAFVRTLVALYEEAEKPDDPLPYICTLMGMGLPKEEEILMKQDELSILRTKYMAKQEENQSLRYRLAKYLTPPEEDGEGEDELKFQFEYDPNNYNYLNPKQNSAEDEAGQDGDDEETPTTT